MGGPYHITATLNSKNRGERSEQHNHHQHGRGGASCITIKRGVGDLDEEREQPRPTAISIPIRYHLQRQSNSWPSTGVTATYSRAAGGRPARRAVSHHCPLLRQEC